MKRQIIEIDESKCNGCGACATACHEDAIQMINGKAKLIRDDYCDGLGDCLPACPTNAITFIEREANAYNESAVLEHKKRMLEEKTSNNSYIPEVQTHLYHWPVQIKLAPINAPHFNNADLLIAADCTAYAYGNFHDEFMKGRVTLIGCPKLDNVDYSEKLTEIFRNNNIKSIEVVRMVVPCCGGMAMAVQNAIKNSDKDIPLHITTLNL